ncbi:hypothetical protein IE077_002283, partial [Cardiosporidium cionae]
MNRGKPYFVVLAIIFLGFSFQGRQSQAVAFTLANAESLKQRSKSCNKDVPTRRILVDRPSLKNTDGWKEVSESLSPTINDEKLHLKSENKTKSRLPFQVNSAKALEVFKKTLEALIKETKPQTYIRMNDSEVTIDEATNDIEIDPDSSMEGHTPYANDSKELHLCSNVPPLRSDSFITQRNNSLVYSEMSPIYGSIFVPMGYTQYIKAFGIPIIATERIHPKFLKHVSKLLADFLDNDRDGIPDNKPVAASIKHYKTVIALVSDEEESQRITKRHDSLNANFRKQISCHMHLFEIWTSDFSSSYYTTPKERGISTFVTGKNVFPDTCEYFRMVPFDWPLWYILFMTIYYGYLDIIDSQAKLLVADILLLAKNKDLFTSFQVDPEMELADFITWSLLTDL